MTQEHPETKSAGNFARKLLWLLLSAALVPAAAFGTEPNHYLCLKCHMHMVQVARPKVNYCKAGGNHNWVKY